MRWIIRVVLVVILLFGLATVGNLIFGDFSAPVTDIQQPVTIDVD